MTNYRAIYLGNGQWAVRRFLDGVCDETQFVFHADDPESRAADKRAIEIAIANNEWRRV